MRIIIFSFSFIKKRIVFCFLLLFVFGWVNAQTDTINQKDKDSKKTGYWIIYGKIKPNSGFADTSIIEEGKYEAGRKTGLWKTYYQNGAPKSQIEYKNNRPNGKFITYYTNGRIAEKGVWRHHFYVDTFERYFPSGQKAQLKQFNSSGKSEGWQIYWFPDGAIELKFQTKKGVETDSGSINNKSTTWKRSTVSSDKLCLCNTDTIKETVKYFEQSTGDSVILYYLNDEKFIRLQGKFSNGMLQIGFCTVDAQLNIYSVLPAQWEVKDGNLYLKGAKDPLPGNETGSNKIYNDKKQIWMEGEFRNGQLWNGKLYIYNQNGLLSKMEIYKQGKYYADGQIDRDPIKD